MGILFNILVIILAVIAFLIIYYITLKKDRRSQDYRLPFKKLTNEYETGEEIGVDRKTMPESNFEKNEKEIEKEILKPSDFSTSNLDFDEGESEQVRKIQEERKYNEDIHLKEYYEKNFIRLFSRDPHYLFAYWEIIDQDYYSHTPYLRLIEENGGYIDIEINHSSRDWYLNSKPDREFSVSIGYKKNDIFYPITASRKVRTPLDRPSNIIDEHWMTIEELSRYSFRIEMDSLSLIKNIEGRKIQEEAEASFSLINK